MVKKGADLGDAMPVPLVFQVMPVPLVFQVMPVPLVFIPWPAMVIRRVGYGF